MRRFLIVLVVLFGALAVGVSQALAKQLVVDKDKVQCPTAEYTSIQAAVTAASPGDKIKVCPDLYTESVTVTKTIDIGADPKTSLADEASCFAATPAAPDPTKDAIVQGAPSFDLQANDIKLEGFVVQNSPNFGVNTSSSFSGYRIADNLAQNNELAGVNFLSSGARESRATHNCFRSNLEGLATPTASASAGTTTISRSITTGCSQVRPAASSSPPTKAFRYSQGRTSISTSATTS
jgi:hypothetical protein